MRFLAPEALEGGRVGAAKDLIPRDCNMTLIDTYSSHLVLIAVQIGVSKALPTSTAPSAMLPAVSSLLANPRTE